MKKKALLPVLALTLAIPFAAPAHAVANAPVTVKSVEFIGTDAPNNAVDMSKIYTNASVKVTYSNGAQKIYPLTYKTLFKSTDKINGTPAGVSIDANGKPIMDNSVSADPQPFVSDDPDSNSLMQIPGMAPTALGGNPLSLVTHYEYITKDNSGTSAYGIIPASMSLTTLDQNKTNGMLKPTDLKKIDFSGVGGLWIPCNGSLSPWNTHLGSEEYEADARAFAADNSKTYVKSFTQNYYQDPSKAGNPYVYGYIPEVTVKADNSTSVVKHYSMGRFSHELSKVMPDNRTVYFGDDGSNTMMFMYVADKEKDLSAGTLYAAKWLQTSDQNGGAANLQWIKLGHATDDQVKSYIDKGLTFNDLFETADQATPGFTKIKTYPSGNVEYLKVKPGMEQAAAFLESRRYGAILGATCEFNKMEGVTLNAKDKKVYIAMSYVEKGMTVDTKNEVQDDIKLPKISSGVTYELSLQGGQKDRSGNAIDSQYVAGTMQGLIVGEDLAKPDALGNLANVDKVANPDNLSYSADMRTLFIGEDSGMHINNYVWAYNIDTHKLSRLVSLPAGAEGTGLQMVDNLNGFSYLMSNIQHPGDLEIKVSDSLKADLDREINKNFNNKKAGTVGYLSGIPALEKEIDPDTLKSTLTPVRAAAEAKGAIVAWDGNTKTVTITKGSNTLSFIVGDNVVVLNGKEQPLTELSNFMDDRAALPMSVLNDFLK
ncbi:alkaline phosphatase PhoX [Tumebacillus flagellatus]|uniref:Alkaline phosphatase n=1 Tax=Tumebacillus flagellatus TaxID=1157490 RepID=A0A074LKQ7_9BACL|nr:alkaline phosphatase PhoX [Tumebacillus flagellatus]KEO81125.1 alkaline phosphatase [Tumebacillus flagellatus]